MQTKKACKHCGEAKPRHWPFQCVSNTKRNTKPLKRTEIKKIGKRGKKNQETTAKFRATLDPNEIYYCYLQIHEWCPHVLRYDQVVPEHVKSKSGNPHLRDDLSNIWVACTWCNGLKGSRSLESLAKQYPHLKNYLS